MLEERPRGDDGRQAVGATPGGELRVDPVDDEALVEQPHRVEGRHRDEPARLHGVEGIGEAGRAGRGPAEKRDVLLLLTTKVSACADSVVAPLSINVAHDATVCAPASSKTVREVPGVKLGVSLTGGDANVYGLVGVVDAVVPA